MKRLTLLTSAILLISAASFAQTVGRKITTVPHIDVPAPIKTQYQKVKVLAPLSTIKLTPAQILRIDSAISVINNTVDSKNTSKWIIASFAPIFEQAGKQLVVDSVKVDTK